MRLIFLDVDGVLNDHKAQDNGYCTIEPRCVKRLARILKTYPDSRIVLSSAWRYLISGGRMTTAGFGNVLMLFGMPYELIESRVIATTETDERVMLDVGIREEGAYPDLDWLTENGADLRALQIERLMGRPLYRGSAFVVLDDMDVPIPNLVRTNGNEGLMDSDVDKAIEILSE